MKVEQIDLNQFFGSIPSENGVFNQIFLIFAKKSILIRFLIAFFYMGEVRHSKELSNTSVSRNLIIKKSEVIVF